MSVQIPWIGSGRSGNGNGVEAERERRCGDGSRAFRTRGHAETRSLYQRRLIQRIHRLLRNQRAVRSDLHQHSQIDRGQGKGIFRAIRTRQLAASVFVWLGAGILIMIVVLTVMVAMAGIVGGALIIPLVKTAMNQTQAHSRDNAE